MKRYIQKKLKDVTLPKERLKQRDSPLGEKGVTWLRCVGGSLLWMEKKGGQMWAQRAPWRCLGRRQGRQ